MNYALSGTIAGIIGLALWIRAAMFITEMRAVALLYGVGLGLCLAVGYGSIWMYRKERGEPES